MSDPEAFASVEGWLTRSTFPDPGTPLRCGVSGGADSLALLALACAAGCEVTAVHVDHGQRISGANESALVEAIAQEFGAAFEGRSVEVEPGPNLEARMRSARYAVLGPDAATGHTLDDQAETVLINLMRGAGIKGLGAMRTGSRRPILALRRTDTEAVCETLGLQPFSDPSNADPRFVRNRVRKELLPLMNDIANRDVAPLLARTATHAREADNLIGDLALSLDPSDARALADAPNVLAAEALRRWLVTFDPEAHPVDSASIERVMQVARGEVLATEVTGGLRVARSEQQLRVVR